MPIWIGRVKPQSIGLTELLPTYKVCSGCVTRKALFRIFEPCPPHMFRMWRERISRRRALFAPLPLRGGEPPIGGRGSLKERIRVGVDTGGTFTDFVVVRGGRIEIFK